jgi:predicted dehydrogenase
MTDYQYTSRATPIRLGLVGGGPGSFAGIAHPIAARLDGRFSIVAGVFSSDAERSVERASIHGVSQGRAYSSIEGMIAAERDRPDGIEAIAVITRRNSHYQFSKVALEAGLHVICEKPITETSKEAQELLDIANRVGVVFTLTHNYSGYPMVRNARQMVRDGRIGDVRMIEGQFTLGLDAARDESGAKRKPWQRDIAGQGFSWVMLEVGSHVEHLSRFVTGLRPVEVCAEIGSASPLTDRDDTAMLLVRYENGARGVMWFTFAAAGGTHGLKLRVHGQTGGLEWRHSEPENLIFTQVDAPQQTLLRGEPGLYEVAQLGQRITRGHPEGFHEAFANIYRDFSEQIKSRRDGVPLADAFAVSPTIEDGLLTLKFAEAAYRSASEGGHWIKI